MTMTTGPSTWVPAEPEAISLYDAIGGRASMVAAVDVFYRRVLADPELSPFFPGGVGERHRAYLVTFLGEALTLDELGVPRHLTDQIMGIAATLRSAVVTA